MYYYFLCQYKKEVVGNFYGIQQYSNLETLANFIFFEFIKTFDKDCSQKLKDFEDEVLKSFINSIWLSLFFLLFNILFFNVS